MSSVQVQGAIRQHLNRLDNSGSSADRVNVLYDLQALARSHPVEVAELCLQPVLDLLRDQGSPEEYQECLELLSRLLKNSGSSNALRLASSLESIELLLDLLGHEDGLIGIMASELLRDIHTLAPAEFEKTMQDCPDGVNKLLHRVADRSREEVGNQALGLIHDLTQGNEDIKRTVAFNEGFDILFNLIAQEGGHADPGVVVQDCLRVCCNILSNSEICQRLFYSMGSSWRMVLLGFFDPEYLEQQTAFQQNAFGSAEEEESGIAPAPWYEQQLRVQCAVLALTALGQSLGPDPPQKHQMALAKDSQGAIATAATFWCGRNGPRELIECVLPLMMSLFKGNKQVVETLNRLVVAVQNAKRGVHVPSSFNPTPLVFGWASDDKQYSTILGLFTERYILGDISAPSWSAEGSAETGNPDSVLALQYLFAVDAYLSVDEMSSGLILQYVLAPPPPSPDDGGFDEVDVESRPYGALIIRLLVESCERLVIQLSNPMLAENANVSDIRTIQKCCNVLCLVLLHGGELARELFSALHLSHVITSAQMVGSGAASGNQLLLQYLFGIISKASRQTSPTILALVVSLIRLVCAAISNASKSCSLILENPSNLFIADLASQSNPDDSRVIFDVQSYACLLLGACFQGLSEQAPAVRPDKAAFSVSKKALLDIIDSKVGLSRFIDILKKRIAVDARMISKLPGILREEPTLVSLHLPTHSFDAFLNSQVDLIKAAIYEFYGATNQLDGPGGVGKADGQPHFAEVVRIQKEEIERLNRELTAAQAASHSYQHIVVPGHVNHAPKVHIDPRTEDLEKVLRQLESDMAVANANALESKGELDKANAKISALGEEKQKAQNERDDAIREADLYRERAAESEALSKRFRDADDKLAQLDAELSVLRRNELSHAAEKIELQSKLDDYVDRFLGLERDLSTQRVRFEAIIAEKDQKVAFLEEELQRFYHSGGKLHGDLSLSKLQQDNNRLVEELEDRERIIKLLEDDLRGATTASVTENSDVSSYKKQVWQLKGELEASKYTAADAGRKILSALTPIMLEVCDPSALLSYSYSRPDSENEEEDLTLNLESLAALLLSDIATCQSEAQTKMREALNLPDSSTSISFSSVLATMRGSQHPFTENGTDHSESKSDEYIAEIARLETELVTVKEECEAATSQFNFVERELDDMNTRYDILVGQMKSVEGQLASSSEQHSTLSSEVVELRQKLEASEASHESLIAEIDRLKSEKSSAVAAADERLSDLKNELEAANAKVASIMAEYSVKQETFVTEKEELRAHIQQLKNEIAELNSKLGCVQYERESEHASESLRNKAILEELVQAKKEIQDLASLVSLFDFPSEGRSSELKDELDKILAIDCSVIDVPQCMTTVYGIINSYDNVYQNSVKTINELNGKIEHMASQLQSAEHATATRVEEEERKIESLSSQLASMTQQYADVQVQLVAEKDRSEAVSRKENDYLRERDALLAELDALRMGSEQQNVDLEAQLNQASNLLEEARAAGSDKDDAIARLQASNSELNADVKSLRTRIADLIAKLEGAESDVKHFQGKLFSQSEPLTQVVGSLRQERDSLRTDLMAKENEVNDLLSERSSLNGRIAGLVVAFEGLQEELQSVRNERDEIETQLDSKAKLLAETKVELSNVTIELRRKEDEISRVLEQSKATKLSMQQKFAMQQQTAITALRDTIQEAYRQHADVAQAAMMKKLNFYEDRLHKFERGMLSQCRAMKRSSAEWKSKVSHADMKAKSVEKKLALADAAMESLKKYQHDAMQSTIALISWSTERAKDSPGGVVGAAATQYTSSHVSSISDGLNMVKSHIDTLVASLQQSNEELRKDLKEKEQSLRLAKTAQSKSESDYAKYGTVLSTPQAKTPRSRITFGESADGAPSATWNGNATTPASGSRGAAVPAQSPLKKELSKLQSELRIERKKLSGLREQHEELLGLLAQQELELRTFRLRLLEQCGARVVSTVDDEVRSAAMDRYGMYIDFRQDNEFIDDFSLDLSFSESHAAPPPALFDSPKVL